MKHCAVVGINWGDEGKGRMVDLLTEHYDVVVRYQGGGNAGHTVINQYGKAIKKTVLETLDRLEVKNAKVTIVDKGALDCTLKARIEGAVYRAVGQFDNLPWGGAIK